ncbi:hypothetical protein J2S43_005748 [Catenuloplanes nepalensis]|uniref:Sortase n=1 Tax=Catenuloplanes nepalensis TaxID=587533 RepID=A0ABT9N1C3_9ACTN|nr:sortase [Catenuloplanes nepalensis]MDP9797236.1 hypothetical protein [Catenuloplanes nepalensis]
MTDLMPTLDAELPSPPIPSPPIPVVVAAARKAPAPWRYFASTVLLTVAAVLLGFAAHLVGISALSHNSAQKAAMDTLRIDLATGQAPVGQMRVDPVELLEAEERQEEPPPPRLLPLGTPVALLTIPRLGLEEVIREGTTGGVLTGGPGHQRDTVLPGQSGTSIVYGRAGAYGAPFGGIDGLLPGDEIVTVTGQGESRYQVTGVRRAGDAVPPAFNPGGGRLTLVTAAGTPFMPAGVLRVDATLRTPAYPYPPRVLPVGSINPAEQPLAIDSTNLWVLVMGIQGLLAGAIGAVWAWHRMDRVRAWVVFLPILSVFGLLVADQTVRLLPNLL